MKWELSIKLLAALLLSSPLSARAEEPGTRWVPLFNGKDLDGWKTDPKQPGRWKVRDGALVSTGNSVSHLFSERGDFDNFHLRVEAKINAKGNSGVYFRSEYGLSLRDSYPLGYEAQIYLGGGSEKQLTGSLYGLAPVQKPLVQPDEWFELEVIADGRFLTIKVDGKTAAQFKDEKNTYRKGHIALQQLKATTIAFRKIEIRELVAVTPKPGLAVIAPKAFHAALAKYIAHKKKQLPVELISLEQICKDQVGDDDAEKLKRFLYRGWKDERIAYVLLVGDIDIMPVRYRTITVGDGKKPPVYVFNLTDQYYAAVADQKGNFDDWNKLRGGSHRWFYAESLLVPPNPDVNADGIHFLPQLAVGRWPVSTPRGAKLMAEKTIRYETGLRARKKPGRSRAAILRWDDETPRELFGRWAGALRSWEVTTYADEANGVKPSAAVVRDQLNQGLGLLIDIGHGETDGWTGFKKRDLAELKNADRLPIVFSIGCDTAPLGPGSLPTPGYRDRKGKVISAQELAKKNPPPPPGVYQPELRKQTAMSFGQQMLVGGPNGAVAYIGFTINSNTCHELIGGFVLAAGKSPAPRLGDAWNSALIQHRQSRLDFVKRNKGNFDGLHNFDQGMRAILLGDPTLLLPP